MDLFLDKQYKRDCENKLDYYDVLFNISHNVSGLTIEGTSPGNYTAIKGENIQIIYANNISDIHVKKNNLAGDPVFCYEIRISATAKKFILNVE